MTEKLGRQVCEQHWRRHQDQQDSFDLFEAFGFKRLAGLPKPAVKNDVARCACGRQREPRRRLCMACAVERGAEAKEASLP